MRKFMIVCAALTLFTSPVLAAHWQVDPVASTLTFSGTQSDESFKGEFKKFTAMIDFDPTHPETGKIDVSVDMKSATVEGKDRQDALPADDWFAVSKFPIASFHATHIVATKTKAGAPAFEAQGELTLRGIVKPATLLFTLKTEGKNATAEGDLTVNRSDFAVGQGRWADDTWIAFPVAVHTVIHANAP